MVGARRTADSARAEVRAALEHGRSRTRTDAGAAGGTGGLLRLQRAAGNAAVSALLAAKRTSPGGSAATDIDGALSEVRGDDPDVDRVEKGLRAAQAAGVPVDLEGQKPPPSALAVALTGFGPEKVPAKEPVPPAKPVPERSPLGRIGAEVGAGRPGAGRGGRAAGDRTPAKGAGALGAGAGGTAVPTARAPLGPDALQQPPVPPVAVRPEDDPAFSAVTAGVDRVAGAEKAHPPAAAKAKEAQDAALAPADDVGAQANAAKVDTMDAQQPGSFDKKAFIAAVKTAIEAKSPKTLKEADEYAESGKAGEVKGEVKGIVTSGKEGQAKDIETATGAPPDTAKAVPKPVIPLAPEQPGPAAAVPAAGAVPKPAPPEQLNLAAGKHAADQELAEGEVTEAQLAQSNEPEFQQALADKQAAAAHADTAPGEYRQQEQQVLAQGTAEATAETSAALTGMHSTKAGALAGLVADKGATKTKDEAKRAEVTARIQGIFAATESDVKTILDGIDPKVDAAFEQGEAKARAAFERYVDAKMSAYKRDRYGGWLGGLRWAKDKLLGMPDKVNEFYAAGRELYLSQMDGVISRVADIVGGDLNAAKKRIATGKAEIASYVKSLPAELQRVGAEASAEIGDRFAQLESEVDAKQEAVVDSLATKYTEARKGLDARIEELQAANQGLVDKAVGALKAVINTIRELASMLRNALARAASVVGDILRDPVGFLGNLIAGVKGGILKFKDSILDHLRRGLMGWLFGTLGQAGVELPETFDVKGVLKLLASLFGLTWANIRNRIVKRIGEKAMGAVEKGVEIFSVLASQGVAGLWQLLVAKLGDIKEMILAQVKDFVVTKIITAGITWLIGLLNPAAAFIKACKLIYDLVMFFVNNASRIATFVNTVLDSVVDIARGNVSSVVNKINDVLGQMVPILIGFLASVIGLGGVGQKVRQIVETLQKPVTRALDAVIGQGLKLAAPLIRGLKGVGAKVKAKVAAGKAWVKGKVEKAEERLYGGTFDERERQGLTAGLAAVNRYRGRVVSKLTLEPRLAAIRARRGLSLLTVTPKEQFWQVDSVAQRISATSEAKTDEHVETATATGSAPPGHARDASGILPGRTGAYDALSGIQDPRSGSFPFLKVYAEHVLPRNYIDAFLRAMGFRGMPPRGLDYGSAETVLMYQGAKSLKDSSDTHWTGAIKEAEEISRPLRDASASPGQRGGAHWDLKMAVERRAHAAVIEASQAAKAEHAANGPSRGPDEPGSSAVTRRPTDGEIGSASTAQVEQLRGIITEQAFDREEGRSPDPNAPIDVNTATDELLELPGIGRVTAAAIIAERQSPRGTFHSLDDLESRVRGIGPAKRDLIRNRVTL